MSTTTATLKQQLSKTTVNSMAEVLSITYIIEHNKRDRTSGGRGPFCSGGCGKLYVRSKPDGGFEERVAFR